ncbi:acetyltransferase, GNAT family [Streptococcus infantarius subsp. infantarius]|uniref:GNAT family N-acetyltransferase n=1 Tax=uncultured Streptococcus sp. TaxID=83427 RepID=UPI00208EAA48|nr:GNAT family protein [uncultured Streptococcus sp.]MCO4584281.1 acetyltransferase, GNAT family [Streptococcus infantarius subsp. infantarius]MCO4599315.1 acetyltransferase, GNAT family [Streptococcus infantarius subsp. infantarius]MCO4601093.1 acetyltransferase, GNAT family [Streptococcus infantarius subsp. infantarius]MCO4607396.1 acetyltransferase, GNAT family [Streptococcus infantarius subsp. infantarius]MCO4609976.1 acetyltransferase, GNAT family [Streptococcus infantarius subsp. infanta
MAEQEVIVEEAQLSDAKALVDLLSQVSQETDFVVAEKILSQEDMEIFLERHLESVNEICLVVRVGKELAGVLNVSSTSSPQTNHIGDIFIAVQEKYWGYGLGSLLMEVALDWACHTPVIRRLELTVQDRNSRAVHLYEKFGFKIEATKERGAKTKDGEFLDVYLMSRLID